MGWADGTLIGLDFETDGVDIEECRIVTATVIYDTPGRQPEVLNWLAAPEPGREIPEQATAVHGITTEHARQHGLPAPAVVREVAQSLAAWNPATPVVAYNGTFDLSLLDRELARHYPGKRLPLRGPVIDPLTLDKAVNKYVKGKGQRQLSPTCARYGIELKDAHSSEADVVATLALTRAMAARYRREIGGVPLEELHVKQRGWYEAQALDFAKYLRKQAAIAGPDTEDGADLLARAEVVESEAMGWPIRPRKLVADAPAG